MVGNDIFVGGGGFDEMIGEGGDDIFVGSDAQDKMDGMSGFDWITYKADRYGVTADLTLPALNEPPIAGLACLHSGPLRGSGRHVGIGVRRHSARRRRGRGNDCDASRPTGSVLTNIGLISGLQSFWLGAGVHVRHSALATSSWAATAATSSKAAAATI